MNKVEILANFSVSCQVFVNKVPAHNATMIDLGLIIYQLVVYSIKLVAVMY